MQTTCEFLTKPENGMIRIPDKFRNKIHADSSVIVIIKVASSIGEILIPPTLDTRKWKFNREEANAR